MKQSLRTLAFVLVATMGWTSQANADLITINFTADNVVDTGGLCDDISCLGGIGWSVLGPVSNMDNWKVADSISLDLGPGTYYFAWYVENVGDGGPGNPAGLLAEILWGGNANVSSSGWEVTTDLTTWTAATSYGSNGGANIWTGANGGPVAGISTDAEWLWTDSNGNVEMDPFAAFRTSITITAVPEPGTLLLLGIGLLGLGIARRRKV